MPLPVYQPPALVQGMKTSQNSGGEFTAILQTVEPSDSGSVDKQLHTYKSGDSRDFGFGAFTEVLMPVASWSHRSQQQ